MTETASLKFVTLSVGFFYDMLLFWTEQKMLATFSLLFGWQQAEANRAISLDSRLL